MYNEYIKFAVAHWELSLAFVAILIYWGIAELQELFSKHGISASHLVTLMNHDEAVILDIRDTEHYKRNHILGALSHPEKNILNTDELAKLKKYHERKVVLVDINGQASNKLLNKLLSHGFKEVFFLKNGMHAWHAAKLPLNK